MLTPHDILFGVVFPAIIAVVAMLLSHLPPWRRDAKTQPWGPAIAIACAFAITFKGIAGWPAFPPLEVHQWLPFAAVAVAMIGIIATAMRRDWIVHSLFSIALIVVTAWLLNKTPFPMSAPSGAGVRAVARGL